MQLILCTLDSYGFNTVSEIVLHDNNDENLMKSEHLLNRPF